MEKKKKRNARGIYLPDTPSLGQKERDYKLLDSNRDETPDHGSPCFASSKPPAFSCWTRPIRCFQFMTQCVLRLHNSSYIHKILMYRCSRRQLKAAEGTYWFFFKVMSNSFRGYWHKKKKGANAPAAFQLCPRRDELTALRWVTAVKVPVFSLLLAKHVRQAQPECNTLLPTRQATVSPLRQQRRIKRGWGRTRGREREIERKR